MSTVAERCQTCCGRGFYLAPCVDCGTRAVFADESTIAAEVARIIEERNRNVSPADRELSDEEVAEILTKNIRAGRWAEAPSCEQCGTPVAGTPVLDPTDRQERVFCSTDCYDRYSESLHQ